MEDNENSEARGDVCDLCQEPLVDGDPVLQVVEDRHPTYDKEIVLHTYHKTCCDNRETVTHDCPHCGSWFHIALLRKGENGAGQSGQFHCPFCGTLFDCDMGFASQTPVAGVANVPVARLKVDRNLLERQTALLGKATDGGSLGEDDRKCLEGLWEFVHSVLDSMEAGTDQGSRVRSRKGAAVPTVVVWVRGGVVQGVEADGRVRVLVCDFDNEDGPDSIGGRPCTIGVWDAPEEPSEEYAEAVRLANSTDDAGSADEKS